jgi:hypothetical protein
MRSHVTRRFGYRKRTLLQFRFLPVNVEERRLCCCMFAQLGHLIDTALGRLLLFSLIPAFGLVPLSLLPCVFLLAFCKS